MWQNAAGQLSFLRHAVAAPPDVFTFAHAARKQLPLQGLPECAPLPLTPHPHRIPDLRVISEGPPALRVPTAHSAVPKGAGLRSDAFDAQPIENLEAEATDTGQ